MDCLFHNPEPVLTTAMMVRLDGSMPCVANQLIKFDFAFNIGD